MTTIDTTTDKVLAYDGDCPMCLATVGWLVRWKLVRPEQTRSNHELLGEERAAAEAAGIRNQLVVLDTRSGQVRVGADALVWIVGDNKGWPFVLRMLCWPGIRQVVRYGYQTIYYNRRVISPPRHQIACDCEPTVTVGRRLSLVVPVFMFASVLVAAFGAALFAGCQWGPAAEGALRMLAGFAAGGAALGIAAFVAFGGGKGLDYLAHLAVTTFVGSLVLVPAAAILPFVPRPAALILGVLSLSASFALMLPMQRRRVAALSLDRAWLWAWAIVVPLAVSVAMAIR
jgi:predicted DCC family thiol-disulfide oxidoreductase YuxK